MLVLSRKKNEELIIGNGIRVRVLEINGNVVRLGLTAPENVVVARGELIHPKKKKRNGLERPPF